MPINNILSHRSTAAIIFILVFLCAVTASGFAVTIYGEDFNSLWTTLNPPAGWAIGFTGDTSTNDWHRKDAYEAPWIANSTPYACLIGSQIVRDDVPDSLISPIINCANYYNTVLRCSTYFSPLSGAYRAVLLGSTDGGVSWPYEIRDYTNQIIPPQLEIFNLPWAWNQSMIRFAWIFEGDQAGLAQWSIDNVSLAGLTVNDTDIAAQRIRRPRRFEIPTTITPRVKFMNVGQDTQYNVPVTCSIIHLPDSVVVHNVSDTLDTFPAGDTIVHDFSLAWTLGSADTGRYFTTTWCDAVGDQERSNDTLDRRVTVGWSDLQLYDDSMPVADSSWAWERYGWGVKFWNDFYPNRPALIDSVKFYFTVTDTLSNRFRIRVCKGDGLNGDPRTPLYESRLLTAVSGWNSYDLSLDSIAVWDSIFYVFFIQIEGQPLSPLLNLDAERDTNASYWACYDTTYVQDFTLGDWMIRCVLNYQFQVPRPNADDFRTVFISNPEENVVVRPPNSTFIPRARIENWGDLPQNGVAVVCSIISITNPAVTPYVSTRTIDLNQRADILLSFDAWAPAFRGLSRITVRTQLQTDMDPTNDAKEETTFVHRSAFVGQDFSVYDYRWIDSDTTGGPTYSWIDTSQNLGAAYNRYQGDEQTWFIPVWDTLTNFTVRYYDTTYRNLWVSDNGWIQLGPWSGYAPPGYPNNTSVPDTLSPNNTIYAFWDDLVFGPTVGGGGIFFKRTGNYPNRKFVVIYQDVRRKNAPNSDPITFEVILAENGVITIQYKDVFCSDAWYNYGRSATIGIDDSTGTTGLQYLYGEAGDNGRYPGNKVNSGSAIKIYPYKKDIALFRKVAPFKYSLPGTVTPQFRVINFGNTVITESFWTKLRIGASYYDSVATNVTLNPGDSASLNFTPINLTLGRYNLSCTTALSGDQITLNDKIAETLYVQAWAQKTDIPLGLSHKKVKDGALAYFPSGNKLYAMKGGNNVEFYSYDIITEKWDSLVSMPDSNAQTGRRRKAKAGTSLCYGNGTIFATKGGNNQDFYSYDIISNTWVERCTIPVIVLGPGGYVALKKPSYGTSLVYAPITGLVYLLSGNKSRQFLSYDPTTNNWRVRDSIPGYYTTRPSDYRERKVKAGGALTCGNDTIYALKGGNSNDFYGFIISRDTWIDLRPVPFGSGNRKVKTGACLVYYQGVVYCFKGGNTTELWIYQPSSDTFVWVPGSAIPLGLRNRKVKRGGAFVATDSLLYAFKGGGTQEFWAYGPEVETVFSAKAQYFNNGTMEQDVEKKITFGVWLKPNPASNRLQIRYGVTGRTKVQLEIYNILGERTKTLLNEVKPIGEYVISWDRTADNGKRLSAGVYLIKITQETKTKTTKLILTE
jgi:hypothetical protein